MGYRVPVHDRDTSEKYAERADIDQKNFHRVTSARSRHGDLVTVSIGGRCDVGPLQLVCPVTNCSGRPPEQCGDEQRDDDLRDACRIGRGC